ncbi:MAG: S8 family serine peptidase [Thermoanaerobaculia bacterium]
MRPTRRPSLAPATGLLIALALLAAASSRARIAEPGAWREKVAPDVLDAARRGEIGYLVVLREQARLDGAAAIHGKARKGRYVFQRLVATAGRTQVRLREMLERERIPYRPFWIANAVWVRSGGEVVQRLAELPEVDRIAADPSVALRLPAQPRPSARTARVEPNLIRLDVPEVFWRHGYKGQGVVVAGADTGYDWHHPALRQRYRGNRPGGVSHDRAWHDAIHSGGGRCGADTAAPCDDTDHGTHTMGIMVGRAGGAHQIGLAPGAEWIGCRNMDVGVGSPSTYTECFQWLLAPTLADGSDPDPTAAPDVVNNSWTCTAEEGCGDPTLLHTVIQNVRAAGIVVVAAAANDGPGCSTITKPPAIDEAAITVAAVDHDDVIADFSSRGPVTSDGSNRLKPDLAAPGVEIVSSIPGGAYASFNGTSMAAPHAAGMVALVLSASECLRGDPEGVSEHLLAGAEPATDGQTCGGIQGSAVPNPVYGHGLLRAALPSCPAGVGGYADGLKTRKLVCRDRSGGGKSSRRLSGQPAWLCKGGRFAPEADDRVTIKLNGTARGAELGGVVRELSLDRVVCRNRRTGASVQAELLGDREWDCAAAGLETRSGDGVVEVLTGTAAGR